MDPLVGSGLAVTVVVLLAAFGLAVPERRRPLLVGSAALVGVIIVAQVLIGLFGAQTARLSLLAAAFLGMVLVGALVWRRRQPS